MNANLMPTTAVVDDSILKSIVDVKETVAVPADFRPRSSRSFGIADLWNIRRNAKLASTMVRRF